MKIIRHSYTNPDKLLSKNVEKLPLTKSEGNICLLVYRIEKAGEKDNDQWKLGFFSSFLHYNLINSEVNRFNVPVLIFIRS